MKDYFTDKVEVEKKEKKKCSCQNERIKKDSKAECLKKKKVHTIGKVLIF